MASGDYDELQSAAKSSVAIFNSVCEMLKCPVCFNTMYPPIHQCFNGHVLCSSCKLEVNGKCPTCRCPLDNTRCLTLEKVAASIELPCKYQKSGCPRVISYCKKLEHESQCSLRPYNCPFPDSKCVFLGHIPYLLRHLEYYHELLMDNVTTFNYSYVKSELENVRWKPMVISCFGRYFCLHFEAFQPRAKPICIAFVQLIGNDEEAKDYRCRLEFEGNGRKTIWQGVPRSIRDDYVEVRDGFDGLIIQQKFFSRDGNGLKLTVSGRIWKENFLSGDGIKQKHTRRWKNWQLKLSKLVRPFSKK